MNRVPPFGRRKALQRKARRQAAAVRGKIVRAMRELEAAGEWRPGSEEALGVEGPGSASDSGLDNDVGDVATMDDNRAA